MNGFNNKIWVFGAITTVLLIAVIMPSIPFSSANTITICDSDSRLIEDKIYDDLLVIAGDSCMMKNVVINGNLYIESDARFTLRQSIVVGNIQADGAEQVIIQRSTVGGNIQIKNVDEGARISISRVGTVDNPIGGNVEIENNSAGGINVQNSVIAGNLEFIKNTSDGTNNAIRGTTIGGSLDCGTDNSEFGTFTGNVVTGAVTGQCAPLV